MWLLFFLFSSVDAQGEYFTSYEFIASLSGCDIFMQMVVGINVNYFADQFALTIIDPSEDSAANAFKCVGGNSFRPISVFDDILQIDLGEETDSSSVSSYPLTNGMFVKSGHDDALGILKIVASHNPRSKVLIHVLDGEIDDSKEVLKNAFDELKMLNLAVVMMTQSDDGKMIVNLILYNPFCGSKDNRQPEYLVLNFDLTNAEENFDKMRKFVDERLTNLHEYPLRVNLFDFPMVSKAVYDDNDQISHYSYVDGETIQIIGEKMNFTIVYVDSNDGINYGFQLEDGNFTGTLGLLEYDEIDLAGNPRLIANYNTKKSLFLQPIMMMRLSFIIKKRKTFKMLIIFIYSQYDEISTIIGVSITLSIPLFYALIAKIERKIVNEKIPKKFHIKKSSMIKSMLYIFALHTNISMSHSHGKATRITVGIMLFYALVVSSLFQSSITKNLNTNQVIGKITSIDELIENDFVIGMPPDITAIFSDKNSLNKVSTLIRKSGQSIEDIKLPHEHFHELLSKDDKFAYLWSDLYVDNYLNQFYDPSTGENLFENVPEIAYEFYISLMAPKGSPFIEKFNEILMRFVETGIIDHHTSKAKMDDDSIWIKRILKGETPKPADKAIKLNELELLFKIYLGLIAISFMIFLLEILIWRPSTKKHNRVPRM
ncbi:hypothetical protein PVAND_001866 [Polypedilum vanderplanki]|uniref:Ionotropic receptor n=1 Tax=Polypedilum vanderplanki TaxID=319348 RepID=A0A9J6BQK9_POLVA|nr:hypothetical protein PVAND_001866 [Polypedilum vanderplanki]